MRMPTIHEHKGNKKPIIILGIVALLIALAVIIFFVFLNNDDNDIDNDNSTNGSDNTKEENINDEIMRFEPEQIRMQVGTSGTLLPIMNDDTDIIGDLIWESNNQEVASVDDNGKITAHSEGTARITATYNERDLSAELIVIVASETSVPSPFPPPSQTPNTTTLNCNNSMDIAGIKVEERNTFTFTNGRLLTIDSTATVSGDDELLMVLELGCTALNSDVSTTCRFSRSGRSGTMILRMNVERATSALAKEFLDGMGINVNSTENDIRRVFAAEGVRCR